MRCAWRRYVYENGIFPVSVLDITEATLMGLWGQACGNVAALSLGAGYPTDCSLPHIESVAGSSPRLVPEANLVL